MADTVEAQVEGLFTRIRFADARVPVGFLGTFRKKNHQACAAGKGFLVQVTADGSPRNLLCRARDCATDRAVKRYQKVGPRGFELLAADWERQAKTA